MLLEDYINKNRQAFDCEEPTEGHFERFEQRLKGKPVARKRYMHWKNWVAAASIILILGTAFIFSGRYDRQNKCVLSGEMKEVQNYYYSQMDKEIGRINSLLVQADPNTRKEVMKDVMQLKMDSEVAPKDLCQGMNSEKEIAAMVLRYQAKIKTLQSMIEFFETNKNRNNNKPITHENNI